MFRSKTLSKAMAVTAAVVVATLVLVGAPLAALGASPIPVVLSFTSTKTTIPDTGARIVLKASLEYAASCKITVLPDLRGFPKSFSCSSDRVTQSVTLRANKGPNPISYTFGMTLKNTAGSVVATNIVVTEGAPPPPISFTTPPRGSPTTLVFAPEGVFVADDPLVVTVRNNSSTTQLISSVAIGTVGDPSDFILNRNNCGYITAHATCSLAVQFQPTGAGTRTGAVNIVDASWGTAGATRQLALRGTGVWATATLSNKYISSNVLIFPTSQVVLTSSPPQTVTVTNVGSVPLYISGLGATGAENTDFAVVAGSCINQITGNFPLIVSLGQTCTFQVVFDPSGPGVRTTNVVVDDNTLPTQTQMGLQGVGVPKPS